MDKIVNAKKPKGHAGKKMILRMNNSHFEMTSWALKNARFNDGFSVLDIGCGGGQAIKTMSDMFSGGNIFGIDYSGTSVRVSKRTNRKLIRYGRVKIIKGSVEKLPFADCSFDVIVSVESFYFWPDPLENLNEVRRTLKNGATLLIVLEIYKTEKFYERNQELLARLPMNYFSADEFRELFKKAGFSDTYIFEESNKGWICIKAVK